jgi:hypothetical protein
MYKILCFLFELVVQRILLLREATTGECHYLSSFSFKLIFSPLKNVICLGAFGDYLSYNVESGAQVPQFFGNALDE